MRNEGMMSLEEEFNKMPSEMKEKGLAVNHAMRRFRKAKDQLALWKKELDLSEKQLLSAQDEMNDASLRWDINTNTMIQKEELKTAANEGVS